MEIESEKSFEGLPQSLVAEMLSRYKELGDNLIEQFNETQKAKYKIRNLLEGKDLLKKEGDILGSHAYPTTCGIDGSYSIDRLLATDIVAIASVAIEGLTPPTERRFWPEPHHLCDIFTTNHSDLTFLSARAVMFTMELELAYNAPHDVIFLDGSLVTPLIHFNQAFSRIDEVPTNIADILLKRIKNTLNYYKEILMPSRSDKIYVGIPKYTSRNEIATSIGLKNHEDKSMLSFTMDGGEVVGPIDLVKPSDYWHFNKRLIDINKGITDDIISAITRLRIIYYKPYSYMPTLRIEAPATITENRNRLSILLEAVKLQCLPSILEPYPLYLADRMVRHLGSALPAIRRAVVQDMIQNTVFISQRGIQKEIVDIFLGMHSYRTEQGG
ncbi:MAG: DNA double-strand break repair nuclease NurA [Candidatus Anstonellales archaeon]